MHSPFDPRRATFDGPHPEFGHRRHHPHAHGPFGAEPGPGPRGHRGGPGFGGRGRGRGRGRAQRGDVRAAILLLLSEEPMHGYQLMQAMAERTNGAWKPSPGAIYPTLNQLQDEGLVEVTNEGGRKLASLTETGRTYLAESKESLGDPFVEFGDAGGVDLRAAMEGLVAAAHQLGRNGTDAQLTAAVKVLAEARRSLYLILAEDPTVLGDTPRDGGAGPTG